jgi:uncharacterized membrane protein
MSDANPLSRIEAFSDGVFAIAATLLVVEIRVPSIGIHSAPGELWRGLADLWPSYVAFVISFGSILIIWVNHHSALGQLTGTSNAFKYANGLLLLTVTFLPFPTFHFQRRCSLGTSRPIRPPRPSLSSRPQAS